MAAPRGRSAAIDLIRVCAIATSVFGDVFVSGGQRELLSAWALPVFLFLAGWLWKPGRPMRQEWDARLRSVLIPGVTWLLAAVVAGLALIAITGPDDQVFAMFGYVAAFVALCLTRRALERFGDGTATVIAVIAWLGSYLLPQWLVGGPGALGVLGVIATAPVAFVVLVAGERARARTPSLRRPVITGLALTGSAVALVAAGVVTPADLARGAPGTPVLGVLALVAPAWGALLLVDAGVRRLALTYWWVRIAAALAALATVGLPVLLAHALFRYLPRLPFGGLWAELTVAVVVPWVLALVLARSPLARYLVGEHPQPARPQLRIVRRGEVPPPRPSPPSHLSIVRIPEPRTSVEQRHIT